MHKWSRNVGFGTGTRGGRWGSSTAGSADLPAVARSGGSTPAATGAGASTGASGIAGMPLLQNATLIADAGYGDSGQHTS